MYNHIVLYLLIFLICVTSYKNLSILDAHLFETAILLLLYFRQLLLNCNLLPQQRLSL